jgi:hypothetical protein
MVKTRGVKYVGLIAVILTLVLLSMYAYAGIFSGAFNYPPNNTYTSDSTPNFNFTVTGQNLTYLVDLRIDGAPNGTVIATNASQTNITAVSTLADGTYTWYINITNGSSVNFTATNRTITIDTVLPTANITGVTLANNSAKKISNVAINFSANDTNLANITVILRDRNGTVVNRSIFSNSTGNFKFVNITSLADSNYIYNITATDNASNKNTSTERAITLDSGKPSINVTVRPNTAFEGEDVKFECVITDTVQSVVNPTLTLKLGDTDTYVSTTSGTYTTVLDGPHILRCSGTDAAGNTQSADAAFTVNAQGGSSSSSSSSSSSGGSSSSSSESDTDDAEVIEDEDIETVDEEVDSGVEETSIDTSSSTWEKDGVAKYSSVAVGEVYKFVFGVGNKEETHSVTVTSVNFVEQSAIVTVASEPQEIKLLVGETKLVDVSQDGVDDLSVTLNAVYEDETVDLSFQKLGNWSPKESKTASAIIMILLLIALTIVVIWLVQRKRLGK